MKYIKHQYQHHHGSHSTNTNSSSSNGGRSPSLASSVSSTKRFKRHSWSTRERTGMSFLIVIAFFAIFGIIILTEIFMIDERVHNGLMLRSGNGGYSNRFGDSMPDYDNVKDDYDLIDANLLSDHKFGFVQFQDNKYKIQDVDNNRGYVGTNSEGSNSRLSGVLINSNSVNNGEGAANGIVYASESAISGSGTASLISWGKILPNAVEESLPHYPFGRTPTDGSWQIVNGTRFKFFIFSAFYDRRDGGRFLRVIGATKTRGPERVWCRLWYIPELQNATTISNKSKEQRYKSVTVMARVKVIRENWNLKYSACFILCPIQPKKYDVPQQVSIVARLKAPPGNLLLVRNTDWDPDFQQKNDTMLSTNSNVSMASTSLKKFPFDEQMSDKLAVCVKPFHFDYNQALFLMEYLEFYALLGVSHFTFYNHTIGSQADCVLQHYIKGDIPDRVTPTTTKMIANMTNSKTMANNVKDNSTLSITQSEANLTGKAEQGKGYNYIRTTVQMLPWNLRMRSQKEIRTEGLFAALNDCLYRSMYRYKYLALVDLDEFVVPRYNDTLIELINSLNNRFRNHNTGAFSFQNAFFYLQFGDDPLVTQIDENESMEMARLRAALITQRKTRRRFKLNPQGERSKYICKPEAVVEAGNHFVWEFVPGKGSFNVPPTEAILQHYRVCEFGGNDCVKAPSILDRTATKYVKHLVERVYEVYKYLKHKCKLLDLPPLPKVTTPARQIFKPIIRPMNEANSEKMKNKFDRSKNDNEMESKIPYNRGNRNKPIKTDTIITTTKKATTTSNKLEMKINEILKLKNETIIKPTTIINVKTKSHRISTAAAAGLSNITTIANTALLHATKTTITTTARNTLKRLTTIRTIGSRQESMPNRRKRKVVVFFVDNQGQPRARVEYH